MNFTPLFAGGIELIAIALIVILLFGASKLPELARAAGASVQEFRRGTDEGIDIQVKEEQN